MNSHQATKGKISSPLQLNELLAGHASENPKLGDLLKEKGAQAGRDITFVGPTSPVMRVLGDKIGANLMAQSAGMSTMPWNGDGMTATLDEDGNVPEDEFKRVRY